ncbi:MAG: hypothetical protein ACJ762_15205 [Solirubrobacteraceae bacterium]
MDDDIRLRSLYRLAETSEGDALERIREAIVARRRQLELDEPGPSAWDSLPLDEPAA